MNNDTLDGLNMRCFHCTHVCVRHQRHKVRQTTKPPLTYKNSCLTNNVTKWSLIVVSWVPFKRFLSLFHVSRFAFSHLQITAERFAAEHSASKLGDVCCHCNVLLGKEVEGVSKCGGYWVLTFLLPATNKKCCFE